ncbi:MAG: hypothetical protein CVV05_01630 [Gammaproteobacteria bacterium HGW-Gammaproteobacteria-1]|jgi:hypothetical protein|nr:MAG: hypothetical protein CVV05_01630 [Gammaproteobacteria bacterium HGW-Gammaproteobacteria-1]
MMTKDWLTAMMAMLDESPELKAKIQERTRLVNHFRKLASAHEKYDCFLTQYGGSALRRKRTDEREYSEGDVLRSMGVTLCLHDRWGVWVTVCWDALAQEGESAFHIAAVQLRLIGEGKPFTTYYRGTPYTFEDRRNGQRNGVRFA